MPVPTSSVRFSELVAHTRTDAQETDGRSLWNRFWRGFESILSKRNSILFLVR